MSSHVLGSLEHFPEGQREAPSAEHCPAQLAPWPHVTNSKVLSGRQQVTLLEWLEKVKTLSKKSTEKALLVLPGNHGLIDELKGSSTKTLTLLQPSYFVANGVGYRGGDLPIPPLHVWPKFEVLVEGGHPLPKRMSSPAQSAVLQTSASAGSPGQSWLPTPQAESVHVRNLNLDPWPHDVEHWLHSPHGLQPPTSTAKPRLGKSATARRRRMTISNLEVSCRLYLWYCTKAYWGLFQIL